MILHNLSNMLKYDIKFKLQSNAKHEIDTSTINYFNLMNIKCCNTYIK